MMSFLSESAAYSDFMKIVRARWSGLDITHVDVQVQGADSPRQLVRAITLLNQQAEEPEVLVMVRGGGSPEDLQAFSAESVVRAIAGRSEEHTSELQSLMRNSYAVF